ncbi:unnamed protein product [Callosobruchus maculatus]|uniref:G-patch domain-containing protein n=1 Tax=Callosobruchus maculatus TaxID=64391 RepID=A0A653C1Q4_CALMS|nr:unnamed protein product [Callosobruchus maculatus]
MSKQNPFHPKPSRIDRFQQMTQQERLIEQKKREILAKLEAKDKLANKPDAKSKPDTSLKPTEKGPQVATSNEKDKHLPFANDGSFLNQFKQLKETKKEVKTKVFGRLRDHEKNYSEDRNKSNRWAPRRRSPSPKDRSQKRNSRFSDNSNFEQKITINTSFSSNIANQQRFDPPVAVSPHNVTGQPLLKNTIPTTIAAVNYPEIPAQPTLNLVQPQQQETVITAPPVLLNVPPPQMVQGQISSALVLSQAPPGQNVLVSTPLLTAVNIPPPLVASNVAVTPVPPPSISTVELTTIPPPNPIQLQNIPQPEPLNTLNIPQPAPIQVQNIPTPNSIQLNEIPNPKPIDLMAIPTPNDSGGLPDAEFIKNNPPPNKMHHETQIPLIATSIALTSTQNVLVPPTLQNIHSSQIVTVPVGVVQVTTVPPPTLSVSVNALTTGGELQQGAPPAFLSQPPPQLPPVNVPPPNRMQPPPLVGGVTGYKDLNAVFPAGSAEYEAMASLARMVAQCGQGIEDMVKKRDTQDPNLWFLFHAESAAYRQYRAIIEEFKRENAAAAAAAAAASAMGAEQAEEKGGADWRGRGVKEEKYEPEMALEEDEGHASAAAVKEEKDEASREERRRKRRSRWGDKEANIAPPVVIFNQPALNSTVLPAPGIPTVLPASSHQNKPAPLLTKLTRNDPGLVQYAVSTYGSANLSEEEWKKAEDNYKVHLVYQEMVRKQEEAKKLKLEGKNKYEYDSDEDTEGGTWEHKAREKEMIKTQIWAEELTKQAEGKHHIGDFLPPEELKKFLEKKGLKPGEEPPPQPDEFKIKEDNVGFRMLQKLGWSEGEGLGATGAGIVDPIKAEPRENTQGLGLNENNEDEDEYESYRKRMMLAYRFRPNPLNNPRRPYY